MLARVGDARIIRVPEDYPHIAPAIENSIAEDTILVARDVYPELLRFPLHRITMMSYFELTQDTMDIRETIIDASPFATMDTACVVYFPQGSADGSVLCGFTLKGGHGILDRPSGLRGGGAFYADSCSPIICHNRITDNDVYGSGTGGFYYSSGQFLYNETWDNVFLNGNLRILYNLDQNPVRIEGNLFGPNPRSVHAWFAGIHVVSGARAVIHRNTFRGLVGEVTAVAIQYGGLDAVITNNTFEDLHGVGEWSGLVTINGDDAVLSDNVFRDILCEDFSIEFLDGRNWHHIVVEGNVFENMTALGLDGGPATACFDVQTFGGTIRNNIFRNNRGRTCGAVSIVFGSNNPPLPVVMEYNLFEACSTIISQQFNSSCMCRNSAALNCFAHFNIFRHNFPEVVAADYLHPGVLADFTLNYWGHPSGPYHPTLNPDGQGDAVGDDVLFEPWLLDTNLASPPIQPPPLPTAFSLEAFPNPFNASVNLKLIVPEPGRYRIEFFDLLGRRVAEVWEGAVVIERVIPYQATDLASGVYFARASAADRNLTVATAKLVLVR